MEHGKKHATGFTLIEVMVTVAILMIIVTVAIPAYGDYVTRGKITEAASTLASLRVSMEQYYQDNRTYLNAAGTSCAVTMPQVGSGTKYFNFSCPGTTATTYKLQADGIGGVAGFQYTVDQTNAKASNFTAPASTNGWTSASTNNCWVTKKGGVC